MHYGRAKLLVAAILLVTLRGGSVLGDDAAKTQKQSGFIECFAPDVSKPDADGDPQSCEISAVLFIDGKLLFANDKPTPKSPLFWYTLGRGDYSHRDARYVELPAVLKARKFEGLTATLDGKYIIATTSFSSDEYHALSNLLVWPSKPAGTPKVQIVSYPPDARATSSRSIFEQLGCAVAKAPAPCGDARRYVKVEGLEVIPGQRGSRFSRLLFALREAADDDNERDFRFLILAMPFEVKDGRFVVKGAPKIIYDPAPRQWRGKLADVLRKKLRRRVGVSGIAYDKNSKTLYFTTSYEKSKARKPKHIGGFVWSLPLAGLDAVPPAAPRLLRNSKGKVVHLAGKAEGITVLGDGRLLVVQDDDRIRSCYTMKGGGVSCRRSNQSAYTVIKPR